MEPPIKLVEAGIKDQDIPTPFSKSKALTDTAAGKGFSVVVFLFPLAPAKPILNKFACAV